MAAKYTLAGESNPNWQITEPLLLKIWSRGILAAGTAQLYLVTLMSWATAMIFCLLGLGIRCTVLLLVGYLAYLLLPAASSYAVSQALTSVNLNHPQPIGAPWMFELGGYILLIVGVLFLIRGSLAEFIRDTLLYALLILGGMLPLRWLARGLQKENYWAQLLAKSPFMGVHLIQTISAAPDQILREWDRVFELYMNSNNESARLELEAMASRKK